jgi:hypothetical protein
LGAAAALTIRTLHSRCLTPRPFPFLARLSAARESPPPLFVCAVTAAAAAAPRSGESDLARLTVTGAPPSLRTFSSAAVNGSNPLCFLLLLQLALAVGDVAAEAGPAE